MTPQIGCCGFRHGRWWGGGFAARCSVNCPSTIPRGRRAIDERRGFVPLKQNLQKGSPGEDWGWLSGHPSPPHHSTLFHATPRHSTPPLPPTHPTPETFASFQYLEKSSRFAFALPTSKADQGAQADPAVARLPMHLRIPDPAAKWRGSAKPIHRKRPGRSPCVTHPASAHIARHIA